MPGPSYIDKVLEKYGLDQRVLLLPVKCTSTSPFMVSIAGSDEDTPARRISGTTSFAVDDMGMAVWSPPGPPYCFKTVDTA